MLSQDTKDEVFKVLLDCRHAYVLDIDKQDLVHGLDMKPFNEMTDDEIVDEYECAYQVHPDDDELYDKMVAEMEAHKMLAPTVSNNT